MSVTNKFQKVGLKVMFLEINFQESFFFMKKDYNQVTACKQAVLKNNELMSS